MVLGAFEFPDESAETPVNCKKRAPRTKPRMSRRRPSADRRLRHERGPVEPTLTRCTPPFLSSIARMNSAKRIGVLSIPHGDQQELNNACPRISIPVAAT